MSESELLNDLYTAVIADALDSLGYRQQVMVSTIRPTAPDTAFVGRAYPIQAVPLQQIRENPYEHELAAVDALPEGSVAVVATGGSYESSVWGELLSTRAHARGAVGAVVDGGVRDTVRVKLLGFPVFAASISPNDSRGRLEVIGHGQAVVCGNVAVRCGDLIVADADGVVVVPAEIADQVIERASAKRDKEHLALRELDRGDTAAAMFDRHGVL